MIDFLIEIGTRIAIVTGIVPSCISFFRDFNLSAEIKDYVNKVDDFVFMLLGTFDELNTDY